MATRASNFLTTKRITAKIMYKDYVKEEKEAKREPIPYNLFRKIFVDTNKEIVEDCLRGGIYNFGHSIGTLQVVKFEKEPYINDEGNVKGLRPDYGATRKNKAAGNTQVIYHTNTLICRWIFRSANEYGLRNRCMWQFAPTDGPKGISRKLHHYIEANPTASINYKTSIPKFLKKKDNV